MVTPTHTHDCDGCTFIGTTPGIDHYFCDQPGREIELIARRSSREDDYSAMPLSLVHQFNGLPVVSAVGLGDTLRLWREFSR